jgi:hypothetical protein
LFQQALLGGRLTERLSQTELAKQSVTRSAAVAVVNLVTPNAKVKQIQLRGYLIRHPNLARATQQVMAKLITATHT